MTVGGARVSLVRSSMQAPFFVCATSQWSVRGEVAGFCNPLSTG